MAVNDYELINWQDGEVITSEKMNRMDSQIDALTEEIVGMHASLSTVIEDKVPYISRINTIEGINNRKVTEDIIGGTIVWNQILNMEDLPSEENYGIQKQYNGDGSVTMTGIATLSGGIGAAVSNYISNEYFHRHHVYYLTHGVGSDGSSTTFWMRMVNGRQYDFYSKDGAIAEIPNNGSVIIGVHVAKDYDVSEGLTFWPQMFDLTVMFGPTIANAILAMETANPGAGAAWFKAMFPEQFYSYNEGELMSVQTSEKTITRADNTEVKTYSLDSSLILRGIPQWDTVKNIMYYDGDRYAGDGTVTRKYGYIANLSTLDWTYHAAEENNPAVYFTSTTALEDAKSVSQGTVAQALCSKYTVGSIANDRYINLDVDKHICIYDSQYTDATEFKAALAGVSFLYLLNTSTVENGEPFTAEYTIGNNDVEAFLPVNPNTSVFVPVGHETYYTIDLSEKLNFFLGLPDPPSEDGTYVLAVTVTNGNPTYSWAAQTESEVTT